MAQTTPSISDSSSIASHSRDLEQGSQTLAPAVPLQWPAKLRLPDPVAYPTPLMTGPRGDRPVLHRLNMDSSRHTPLPRLPIAPRSAVRQSPESSSPLLRSPSPRTHRQRAIADQIEMLRIQMLELEREDGRDYITMNEMCEKMAWLRKQQEGPWALGLTEVTPLGYDRYMTVLDDRSKL